MDTSEVRGALEALPKGIIRGKMLTDRFAKGHEIVNQSHRHKHFRDSLRVIENWFKD